MGRMFDRMFGRTPLEPELELTPEMEADRQRTGYDYTPLPGMVRQPDHTTSVAAAKVVEPQRETLKSRVLQFAKDAGPGGFIDEELLSIDPARPESSLRKRRTELTEKNWILALPFTRPNSHKQDATVWIHRDFHPNPPPLVSAPKKRKLSAEQERAKVVAFLRQRATTEQQGRMLMGAASAIESGAHLQ